ncbi:MAG: GNAT family protein [Actinomycetota bacterium]|nr:GNAT family protein [Actinomycetota bacterium]
MDRNCEQPLGEPVAFAGATVPGRTVVLRGPRVVLRPVDPEHDAPALYAASHPPDGDPSIWTYLYDGPYPDPHSFQAALSQQAAQADPLFLSVTDAATGQPLGVVSYMSIVPEHGVIEIGNIWFGPRLRRTPAATETIFLLASHAFDELGYRRLEWKCNALNEPSRSAALRFGFHYEGTFANHRVVKGRNRDTAWFAITVQRWPALRAAFERWLAPDNFDASGAQRSCLGARAA